MNNLSIKNTSIYFSANILIAVGQFILIPIYTLYLKPIDWGNISLFLLFGPTILGVVSLGLPRASYYFYFKIDDENQYKKLHSTNFFFLIMIYFTVGTLVFLYSGRISNFFFNGALPPRLIILSYFSAVFQLLSLYIENVIAAQERAYAYISISITRFVFSAAISLYFLIFLELTFMARIYAIIITNILSLILSLYFFQKYFTAYFSIKSLKKSLKFSYPELPITLFGLFISSFSQFFLANVRGLESLGIYSFATKFVDALRELPNAARKSWNPFYFKSIAQGSFNSKKLIIKRFEHMFFFISIPCLIVVLFSEEIVSIFGNNNYRESIMIIPIYAFTYYISITDFLSSNQITSSEKLLYQLPSSMIGGVINITANYFLIRNYGALGAALAIVIYFSCSHLINMHYGNKLEPLPLNKKIIFTLFTFFIIISIVSIILTGAKINFIYKAIFKLFFISLCILIIKKQLELKLSSIFKKIF